MSTVAAPRSPLPSQAAALAFEDWAFKRLCQGAALMIILISLLLVVVLVERSLLAISKFGLSFLVQSDWNPNADPPVFGSLAFVWGTVVTSLIAMLIALPLGIGTAAYLSEIASPGFRRVASFFLEMLAAIPSVIYGFWGIAVLAPLVGRVFVFFGSENVNGYGMLSAGLVLSIMIVPYIAAITYDVCQAVPRSQREGALALGATRWQTISSVVLPYASPGIIAGGFLALGRALGETMAVTMLIGGNPLILFSFDARGESIASKLASSYTGTTSPLTESVLVELGLLLMLVTVGINSVARLMLARVGSGGPELPWLSWQLPLDGKPWVSAATMNGIMTNVLFGCVAVTMSLLVFILGYLMVMGGGSLSWDLFTQLPPKYSDVSGGGLVNAIIGSFQIVGLATLIAVPVGLLAAIYLAEYPAGTLAHTVRFIAEQLGGVPSIVIGVFAWALFQMFANTWADWTGLKPRLHGWSGVFALAVIMVPIVLRATEEALKLVPSTLRTASYALGASQAQTILLVVVPAALPAIITAVFLSVARIAGETAPLLLTSGKPFVWHRSLGDYVATLPPLVFQFATEGSENQKKIAWAGAFLLMLLVLLFNFGIRLVAGQRVVSAARAD